MLFVKIVTLVLVSVFQGIGIGYLGSSLDIPVWITVPFAMLMGALLGVAMLS